MVLKCHFHFPQNPSSCRIPGPRATFRSQIPTPGQFFELTPGVAREGCTQLDLTETLLLQAVGSWLSSHPLVVINALYNVFSTGGGYHDKCGDIMSTVGGGQ